MLGFKRFEGGCRDDSGHRELAEKIKKHQFNFRPLTGKAITAVGNVGRGLGGLKSAKSFARQKHTLNKICTRTQQVDPDRARNSKRPEAIPIQLLG
jgi:hypothetical protein